MFSKSRGIFFRLVSNYEVFFSFAENWDYLQIVITICLVAQVLEIPGIDPRTSQMQSEHSTI